MRVEIEGSRGRPDSILGAQRDGRKRISRVAGDRDIREGASRVQNESRVRMEETEARQEQLLVHGSEEKIGFPGMQVMMIFLGCSLLMTGMGWNDRCADIRIQE